MNISSETFAFLTDLKKNNDRDWFAANKKRYESAKKEFITFVDGLIKGIARFDSSVGHHQAKDCIFRIHRDIRFSKDKSPYKTHFGAHVTPAKKKSEIHSQAGYYIHLEPGASMLAGGAYLPEGTWLKAIRQEIDYNGEKLKKILTDKNFKMYFGEMQGDKLKTNPRGYTSDHPDIELLRHKSFLAVHSPTDKQVLSSAFPDHALKVFETLRPFDEFLNDAQVS